MAHERSRDSRSNQSHGSAGASPSQRQRADLPQRAHPAHGVARELNKPTIVFLTVCTKGRQRWLASEDVHDLLRSVWSAATAWLVGRYVIMPDHLHLFAGPNGLEIPFDNWVRYWKSQFTRLHNDPSHRWQSDHWDRRLRDGESYEDKWEYVRLNPVRHGLIDRADDWRYAGELNVLPW
jgi:putative transposase